MSDSIREIFHRVRRAQRRIGVLADRIDRYHDMAMKATSGFSAVRYGGTESRSKVEDGALMAIEQSERLQSELDRCMGDVLLAEEVIERIDNERYQMVLELRYLKGDCWDDITNSLGYDKRYVFKLHGQALLQADRVYEDMQNRTLKDTI